MKQYTFFHTGHHWDISSMTEMMTATHGRTSTPTKMMLNFEAVW